MTDYTCPVCGGASGPGGGQCHDCAQRSGAAVTGLRGGQPPPAHNDGPSMHDLIADDLRCDFAGRSPLPALLADVAARRQFGLDKYGTILQAGNGRDALRDLYDEFLDAAVYARQWLEEDSTLDWPATVTIRASYDAILVNLIAVRAVLTAREDRAGVPS